MLQLIGLLACVVQVEAICTRWAKGLDAVFDAGQALLDAKGALPYGEFEDMIRSRLPFRFGTARKMIAIAAKPLLADRSIRNVLPVACLIDQPVCLARVFDQVR